LFFRRHTPAADACYYNDYDFYDLTAKKVRRDAGASAPPGCISFKRKKPFVFLLYWNASREMPARALAKATWSEIGYGKGKGREERRTAKKEKGVPSNPEEKAVQFWDFFLDAEEQGAAKGAGTFVLCFLWLVGAEIGWVCARPCQHLVTACARVQIVVA
jgi:hypothetical protein